MTMYECNYCAGSGKVDKSGNPSDSAFAYGRFYLCPLCKGDGQTEQPVYAFERKAGTP